MKIFLKTIFLIFILPIALSANVVRPAPNFLWKNLQGSMSTLSSLRGNSAVLIVTDNVDERLFRKQLNELRGVYQFLGAAKVFTFVAFTQAPGRIPSNIPCIVVSNGPDVAATYGMSSQFGIAIIGRDGNLDYVTNRVMSGQRVLDIVNNSFAVQQALRRD